MMPLVFVVDGFRERRNAIQRALENAGYRVKIFATTYALEAAEQDSPDAMVISSNLPDGGGIRLCSRIREFPALSRMRLLLLADSESTAQQILNESCADALAVEQAIPEEVASMVNAMMERSSPNEDYKERGDIVINSSAMRVAVRGKEISTTTLEFRLIDYMARHQGKVFSRNALLDAVWGDLQFVTPRSVDACVRRIRRKIESQSSAPTFLKSVRGIGYRLDASPVWESQDDFCSCPICAAARMRTRTAKPAEDSIH